eukprot:1305492-Karenia_brevis.AAC.1
MFESDFDEQYAASADSFCNDVNRKHEIDTCDHHQSTAHHALQLSFLEAEGSAFTQPSSLFADSYSVNDRLDLGSDSSADDELSDNSMDEVCEDEIIGTTIGACDHFIKKLIGHDCQELATQAEVLREKLLTSCGMEQIEMSVA